MSNNDLETYQHNESKAKQSKFQGKICSGLGLTVVRTVGFKNRRFSPSSPGLAYVAGCGSAHAQWWPIDLLTSIIYILFISVRLFSMKGDNPSVFLYVCASDKAVGACQCNYCKYVFIFTVKLLCCGLKWKTAIKTFVLECSFLCHSTGISVGDHFTSQPWHWACPFFCSNTWLIL